MVDKAAADKNDITHGIDAAQFPDRINEDDRVTRLAAFRREGRSAGYRETETFGKTRDFMGPSCFGAMRSRALEIPFDF